MKVNVQGTRKDNRVQEAENNTIFFSTSLELTRQGLYSIILKLFYPFLLNLIRQ